MTNSTGQKELIEHYQSLLAKHGDSPQALQYRDAETQIARFKILGEVASSLNSVLDVGCGLGHLYLYLKSVGFDGKYIGVDIVPEFAEMAARNFKDDENVSIQLASGLEPLPTGCDYVLLSGVFNNRMPDNKEFMETTLRQMFASAEKGIAFNAMTSHVDYYDENLYYVDPIEVFSFCKKELGGHPVLRHDYVLSENGFPFEFAVYVYKEPRR